MTAKMTEEQIYEEAKKRVMERQGFFVHFSVYVIVNAVLILIWAFPAGGGFPWFIFPLVGWGIGVLFHFLGVFVFNRIANKAAIEKEIEKIKKEQG